MIRTRIFVTVVVASIVLCTGLAHPEGLYVIGTLGTQHSQALNIVAGNFRALRLEPHLGEPNIIGGHTTSVTSGVYGATIGGGDHCYVTDHSGTVGGGAFNTAGDSDATLSDAREATVGGGYLNTAAGRRATVAGGGENEASGMGAAVPGGWSNRAQGNYSFAAGYKARANNPGTFAWADSSTTNYFDVSSDNRFGARASGGVYLYTNSGLTTGSYLAAGSGTWASVCDRNVKENIRPADGKDVLRKLASVPVSTWNYKTEDDSIRHMGPMAQDLHAAFGLGDSERSIGTIDIGGISFAAIQGLHQLVKEKDGEIAELKERLAKLEALVKTLAEQERGEERKH